MFKKEKKKKIKKMKIKPFHRKKLENYLKVFYEYYPDEKYTVFHFVRYLKLRLKDNKDAWIGVCGTTGMGKSFFSLIVGILFGRPFSLKDNVTYFPKGKEILVKFTKLFFNVLIIDEAAKQMRSVQWQDKQQQEVNLAAMTERYKINAVLLNMPNFDEFTKSMRRGSILFRAVVIYRTKTHARIIIQRKSRNWRSEDPWGDKAANDTYNRFEKKKKELTNEIILDIERSIPNTIMDFIIPNLEIILPEITDKYSELKTESRKIDSSSDPINKRNVYKEKFEDLLSKITKILFFNELQIGKVKTTKVEAATAMGISVDTFNKYLAKNSNRSTSRTNFRN